MEQHLVDAAPERAARRVVPGPQAELGLSGTEWCCFQVGVEAREQRHPVGRLQLSGTSTESPCSRAGPARIRTCLEKTAGQLAGPTLARMASPWTRAPLRAARRGASVRSPASRGGRTQW